jgi:hypothetical protein
MRLVRLERVASPRVESLDALTISFADAEFNDEESHSQIRNNSGHIAMHFEKRHRFRK